MIDWPMRVAGCTFPLASGITTANRSTPNGLDLTETVALIIASIEVRCTHHLPPFRRHHHRPDRVLRVILGIHTPAPKRDEPGTRSRFDHAEAEARVGYPQSVV